MLDRNRLTVDNVTARVNGGAVSITGALSTARNGGSSEIVFKGSGIALDVPAGVVSELSGEIRATSPGPRGLTYGLAGDIFVQPGIVRSSLRQLALSATAATAPGTTASNLVELMKQIGLDVRVRTIDDLVADSNELKLSVAGDVTVTGTLAVPGMKGALTVTDEGELFFGGKLYAVTSGSIDFVNPNSIDPRLNVVAEHARGRLRRDDAVARPPDRHHDEADVRPAPERGRSRVAAGHGTHARRARRCHRRTGQGPVALGGVERVPSASSVDGSDSTR